jgi:hypothetical protein
MDDLDAVWNWTHASSFSPDFLSFWTIPKVKQNTGTSKSLLSLRTREDRLRDQALSD